MHDFLPSPGDPKCGYGWECWHFTATAQTTLGEALLIAMGVGITILTVEWIVRKFRL